MKNKVIISLLVAATVSILAVSVRQPEFAEGVGKAWAVLFTTAEIIE